MGDPLSVYGLGASSLLKCPWIALISLWGIAFVTGRSVNTLVLRPGSGFRRMLAAGHASPGGVYLSLRGYSHCYSLLLGLPMICSQTFMEEFIFRGLLISLGNWSLGLLGASDHLTGLMSVMGSSTLFGLLHFIPAFLCLRKNSIAVPLYAFIMPTTLAIVFCALNHASCSLWPGWIAHFSLNYAGFAWDRIFGTWEMHGRE
jgi:membrane protease YdiL (CAAX protease family)